MLVFILDINTLIESCKNDSCDEVSKLMTVKIINFLYKIEPSLFGENGWLNSEVLGLVIFDHFTKANSKENKCKRYQVIVIIIYFMG